MFGRQAAAHREWRHLGYIVVTFAAFALEAYIYDFGARHFGESTNADLDRLSILKKFRTFPQLAGRSAIPTGEHAFGLITKLFDHRDSIVHYKSTIWEESGSPLNAFQQDAKFRTDVNAAIRALDAAKEAFLKVEPTSGIPLSLGQIRLT